MADVAAAVGLSETAFLLPGDQRGGAWGLRWFTPEGTPAAEVELCGHATLAAAHRLWELGAVPPEQPLRFRTRFSGELRCERMGAAVRMDFPAQHCEPRSAPADLLKALGLEQGQVETVAFGPYDWIVVLGEVAAVRGLTPDFKALAAFECRGVAVTAHQSGGPVDLVSRFFAPRHRIEEDPVTGSLHCVLATLWAERLGRDVFTAEQASRRGGRIGLELIGDRVYLTGHAVTVAEGRWVSGAE